MASRARLEAILEAKSAILEAKMARNIFPLDFWEGSVEWRDVLGYAKSTASTAGALPCFTCRGILSRLRQIETASRRPPHPLGCRHVLLEAESVESSGFVAGDGEETAGFEFKHRCYSAVRFMHESFELCT